MKKLICAIVLIITSFSTHAQKLSASLADKHFNNYQYAAAARIYEKLYESGTNDLSVIEKLATCYSKLNNPEKAEKWLEKAIDNGSQNNNLYKSYAAMLAANDKHEKALIWFQKAYALNNDKTALKWKNAYSNLDAFYEDSSLYKVSKVQFNSGQSDFSPAFFGKGLVFCSARDNGKIAKYKYDFNNTWFIDFFSIKDSLSTPTLFSKRINSSYHEGPMAFNATQDTIYFTRNQIKDKKSTNSEGINKLNIYYAAIKDGKWGKIQGIELNNSEFSIGHPTFLSAHEMIFASDMPGGYGGTDLYISRRKNGIWQAPVNLGPEINTTENELFPFIDENSVLYFASNGHPGLGGLDIFYATLTGNEFKFPKNMGFPINSPGDDFGLIRNNNSGYFSSNRNSTATNDNIYSFVVTNNKIIYLIAKDGSGAILTDVNVSITPFSENQNLKIKNSALKIKLGRDKVERINFTKQGYNDSELIFSKAELDKLRNKDTICATLTKIEIPKPDAPIITTSKPALFKEIDPGQIVELDIKYDVNRANISQEAAAQLDVLVSFLKIHPEVKVELGSHSDSRGSAELNQQLSQKRAEAAVDYITSKGIDESRLVAVGYGKNQLKIVNAKTEADHRQNRRTTIKIIGEVPINR